MQLVRIDPLREMERLHHEFNRLFDGGYSPEARPENVRPWIPAIDIAETADAFVVRAELPGMKRDDIDIELTGETLTLKGERRAEDEEHKDRFVRVERRYGQFQRTFTLATPVQSDKVSATYRDGILDVRLPKSEATRPRKVQVTAE